jgi:ABC-type sugar transport system substrate-binding protein
VRAAGRNRIVIVGFDAIPEARTAILEDSPLKADAIQFPVEIGRRTIEAVAARLRGDTVPAHVPVRVGIVDRDSLRTQTPTP